MLPQEVIDYFKIIKYEKKETKTYEAWYVELEYENTNYDLRNDLLDNNLPEWIDDILYKDNLSPSAYHLLLNKKKKYVIKNNEKVLSFGFMNDLSFCFRKDYPYESEDEILSILEEIKKEAGKNGYYMRQFFYGNGTWEDAVDLKCIEKELKRDGYQVYNYYDKYYVVAFALNYTRFNIESKGYSKRLISWRDDDDNDPVVDNEI